MYKYFFLFSILFIVLFTSCNSTKKLVAEKAELAQVIKNKFVPDSRVAVFNVETIYEKGKVIYKGETNIPEAKLELLSKTGSDKVVDEILILPSNDLGENTFGVIKLSVCNIRTKPKHSSELSTQAILGTPVNILKKKSSWYYIQTPDGYLGWVDSGAIVPMNHTQRNQWQKASKIIYINPYGSVYVAPDLNSGYVSDIVGGSILKFNGKSEDTEFWKVGYPDGREGYVSMLSADLLSFHLVGTSNFTGEDIVSTAYEMMGIPYLWGGTSFKAADCSGFTKTVYFMYGIVLPRDASQQVQIGEKIPIDSEFSKLKEGDLLFFGSKRKDGTERITHVAIYIGAGEIIHATGEVKVQSLIKGEPDFAENRLKTLMQVRRVIGNDSKLGVNNIKSVNLYWK